MTAPLTINGIHKAFGKNNVLNDISFELREGEIFGLIGLNGAGKTTLIKIILNLLNADKGSASIFNLDSASVEARQKLCYLPEKFQPSRYLKGREFLSFALSYYNKKLDSAKADDMARAFDLRPEMLNSRVGAYSKGMGQKLGLLSAFMADVPFLILDEPMSGLDPSARIKLKRMLLDARKNGASIFFSSHILSDIDEICDRIGIIHGGELIYIGTPQAFKEAYNNASLEIAFLKAIGAEAETNPEAA
ncbi:MAG: ABC transporter ATP-binding protein [Alphaproteobacteria bacterium]|nr:ABC transporter ATP-binding protein [Alphaproteobacteria bacterium]